MNEAYHKFIAQNAYFRHSKSPKEVEEKRLETLRAYRSRPEIKAKYAEAARRREAALDPDERERKRIRRNQKEAELRKNKPPISPEKHAEKIRKQAEYYAAHRDECKQRAREKFALKNKKDNEQPCIYCKKFAGGCSWTSRDKYGMVAFQPVAGWEAKKTKLSGRMKDESYEIISCPEFESDGSYERYQEKLKKRQTKDKCIEVMYDEQGTMKFFPSMRACAEYLIESGVSHSKKTDYTANAFYTAAEKRDADGFFRFLSRDFFILEGDEEC